MLNTNQSLQLSATVPKQTNTFLLEELLTLTPIGIYLIYLMVGGFNHTRSTRHRLALSSLLLSLGIVLIRAFTFSNVRHDHIFTLKTDSDPFSNVATIKDHLLLEENGYYKINDDAVLNQLTLIANGTQHGSYTSFNQKFRVSCNQIPQKIINYVKRNLNYLIAFLIQNNPSNYGIVSDEPTPWFFIIFNTPEVIESLIHNIKNCPQNHNEMCRIIAFLIASANQVMSNHQIGVIRIQGHGVNDLTPETLQILKRNFTDKYTTYMFHVDPPIGLVSINNLNSTCIQFQRYVGLKPNRATFIQANEPHRSEPGCTGAINVLLFAKNNCFFLPNDPLTNIEVELLRQVIDKIPSVKMRVMAVEKLLIILKTIKPSEIVFILRKMLGETSSNISKLASPDLSQSLHSIEEKLKMNFIDYIPVHSKKMAIKILMNTLEKTNIDSLVYVLKCILNWVTNARDLTLPSKNGTTVIYPPHCKRSLSFKFFPNNFPSKNEKLEIDSTLRPLR